MIHRREAHEADGTRNVPAAWNSGVERKYTGFDEMPLEFFCPLGHVLSAEEYQRGAEVRCPQCGQRVFVPELVGGCPVPPESPLAIDAPNGSVGNEAGLTTPIPPPPPPPSEPPPCEPLPPVEGRPPAAASGTSATAGLPWRDAYKASRGRLELVRWLALGLLLATFFGAAPAVLYFRVQPTPMWVWLVFFITMLQGGFIAWMVVTPDWATLRVVMLFLLLVAFGYGLTVLRVLTLGPDEPMPWGLDAVRPWVSHWCTSVLLVTTLGAYLCGYLSAKWRRAFKLEMAQKAAQRRMAG